MPTALTHPQLLNCRRLFLQNYEVWINIGVHDFEKKGEQRVLINVDLYVPLALSTPRHDQLDEVLDYDFIRRTIAGRVARGRGRRVGPRSGGRHYASKRRQQRSAGGGHGRLATYAIVASD